MIEIETFEDYINHLINEGFVAEDLTPLKCCHCEGASFTEYDHDYMDYLYGHGNLLLEYKLKCNDCSKDVGYWVAGSWTV